MDCNADDFGERLVRRTSVQKVLVPIADLPVRGSGGGETGEREGRCEDMLAEAGIGIFGVEGVDEQGVAGLNGNSRRGRVEQWRAHHLIRQNVPD